MAYRIGLIVSDNYGSDNFMHNDVPPYRHNVALITITIISNNKK